MRIAVGSALLGLASTAAAQLAQKCPGSGVCYQLNVPSSTASQGQGDIFFQISAPTSFSWVAMGQGSGMAGAQIFVVYLDESGTNVTISPRLGQGHFEPEVNSNAQVTLLEGSGVSNGKMVANVRCSSCSSWNGGSMDFSESSANFIFAALSSGDAIEGTAGATISQHDVYGGLDLDLAQAKGGNSVNPFVSSGGSGTATSCRPRPTASATGRPQGSPSPDPRPSYARRQNRPTGQPTPMGPGEGGDKSDLPFCDEVSSVPGGGEVPSGSSGSIFGSLSAFEKDPDTFLLAHGVLASLAFVVLFPLGGIIIRLLSFPGLVWLHGAFQIFAYLVYIAAFGIGVYIAKNTELMHEYHPIIGIVVLALIFFQPILGFLHHQSFKKQGKRSIVSYAHLWLGRIVITLGIINGGLGLMLADNTTSGPIAYGIVAGVIWLLYVVSIVLGERRRANQALAEKQGQLPQETRRPSDE